MSAVKENLNLNYYYITFDVVARQDIWKSVD